MASGQFFDPITLLRVAPLVTSTVAVQYSVDQYLFLNNLVAIRQQPGVEQTIPAYFRRFFKKALPVILGTYSLTIAGGLLNSLSRPHYSSSSSSSMSPGIFWYKCGTALAVAHFAFVPAVMWKVEGLFKEDGNEDKGREGGAAGAAAAGSRLLGDWLSVHVLRSVAVDLPAWLCFSVAALKTLREV